MMTRKGIIYTIVAVAILLVMATTLDVASMTSLDMRLAEVRKRAAAMMTSALAQTSQPTAAQPPAVPPTQTPATKGTLARVVDALAGDTIMVGIAGKTYVICYAGIDAPDPATGIGSRAIQANRRFVKAKTVYLEKDASEADQSGCLVRHVFLEDGTFVGAKLVYFGYAVVRADYPNTRYRGALLKMQQWAKEAEFGLWNPGPVPSSLPGPAAAPAAVLAPSAAPQPPSPAKPVPPSQPPTTAVCDCSNDSYNCPGTSDDFSTRAEAQACYEYCISLGRGDIHRLDGDNDGIACESLR